MQKAQAGDEKAREEIVKNNTGLIYMVLKRFENRSCEMEDLFQIGAIGLIRAIDKFDLSMNYEFSTYAVPMIIGEIRRFLRDDGMIHVSRQIKENAYKIAKVKERWTKEYQREPTLGDMEKELGIKREDLLMAMEAAQEVDCLHRTIHLKQKGTENGRMILEDVIPDQRYSDTRLLDKIMVSQMLEKLDKQDRSLMVLRYMEGKTQSEVAKILNMNQVAVSRLEKKIRAKLREEWKE